MKKLFLVMAVVALLAALFSDDCRSAVRRQRVMVCFQTDLHCENCALKIRENVSFEKGVKDLKTDVAAKTVTIVFDAAKTDTLSLGNAIRKLGYTASVIEMKNVE